jgi:DNA-binding HxlR family transcriptional regulator
VIIVGPHASYSKKLKSNNFNKSYRLNQCDIDILRFLRNGAEEVISIHETLTDYSDQEVSLNLSWLERKGFVKKVVFDHPAGFKTISYQLDSLGKDYVYRN